MRSIMTTAILLAVLAPVAAHAAYWEPGTGAAPETHYYTICDTIRQFCYNADLEFVVPVLHGQTPYWVIRADMTILAGFPPNMEYPHGFVAEPWRITGEPVHDMDLLGDLPPAGIPASTYVMLYDGVMRSPFVDQSRTLADSLHDTIFGINGMMDGPGTVRVGESWGSMVVTGTVEGLYTVEYVGEGSASFLVDPSKPMPLAGVYNADRYDPYVGDSMWFHAGTQYMDTLLGVGGPAPVDVSGPDGAMRAGTLAGLSWTSDTYQVLSLTTSPDRATIRGHASGPGRAAYCDAGLWGPVHLLAGGCGHVGSVRGGRRCTLRACGARHRRHNDTRHTRRCLHRQLPGGSGDTRLGWTCCHSVWRGIPRLGASQHGGRRSERRGRLGVSTRKNRNRGL